MNSATKPLAGRTIRHDGWTPERRREFIEALSAGFDVSRACVRAGLSRQAAYRLRRRDPEFAQEWRRALQAAHEAGVAAFLAALPESILRTLSDLSTLRELRPAGISSQDTVNSINTLST